MKFIRKVWKWLIEWEIPGIIIGLLLVKFSYDIIKFLFRNVPWDQRLNPGVDSMIYFLQTVAIFFMSVTVVWWWYKRNFTKLANFLQNEMFEDEANKEAAVSGSYEKRNEKLALLIPAFMLLYFALLALAVFP